MDRFGVAHRISRKQDRLLDRLRDRWTDAAAGLPGTVDSFAALVGEEFALLVTFRRSGEPVPTPVWSGLVCPCPRLERSESTSSTKTAPASTGPACVVIDWRF